MDLGIKDLRVLVTAGASGIGLEIARAFVREGAKVHICDVDTPGAGGRRPRAIRSSRNPSATWPTARQVARLFDEAR